METFETERLIIRPWTMNDAEAMYNYAKSDVVGPMAGWKPHTSIEETKAILELFIKENETWALVSKENNKIIGSIGLHHKERLQTKSEYEIGYVLEEQSWGQGIIVEACKKILEYAFVTKKIDRITIAHFPFNTQSKRVIEKLKFKYQTRIEKNWKRYDGVVLDEELYLLTRQEYLNQL